MLADATGHQTLREREETEGTSRGAWMSAAVTLGLVRDFEEAFSVAASESSYDPCDPNPANVARYREMRERMNDRYARESLATQ